MKAIAIVLTYLVTLHYLAVWCRHANQWFPLLVVTLLTSPITLYLVHHAHEKDV
jgi:hypothetical protein